MVWKLFFVIAIAQGAPWFVYAETNPCVGYAAEISDAQDAEALEGFRAMLFRLGAEDASDIDIRSGIYETHPWKNSFRAVMGPVLAPGMIPLHLRAYAYRTDDVVRRYGSELVHKMVERGCLGLAIRVEESEGSGEWDEWETIDRHYGVWRDFMEGDRQLGSPRWEETIVITNRHFNDEMLEPLFSFHTWNGESAFPRPQPYLNAPSSGAKHWAHFHKFDLLYMQKLAVLWREEALDFHGSSRRLSSDAMRYSDRGRKLTIL